MEATAGGNPEDRVNRLMSPSLRTRLVERLLIDGRLHWRSRCPTGTPLSYLPKRPSPAYPDPGISICISDVFAGLYLLSTLVTGYCWRCNAGIFCTKGRTQCRLAVTVSERRARWSRSKSRIARRVTIPVVGWLSSPGTQ
jgi:hypothetical protein